MVLLVKHFRVSLRSLISSDKNLKISDHPKVRFCRLRPISRIVVRTCYPNCPDMNLRNKKVFSKIAGKHADRIQEENVGTSGEIAGKMQQFQVVMPFTPITLYTPVHVLK